jgi:hypothetical protein
MSLNDEWRRGYALQARADLESLEILSRPENLVPKCQRLHFLQMACEKLAKAHLLDFGTKALEDLRSTHAVVAKHLPIIIDEYYRRQTKRHMGPHLFGRIRSVAREIELLAPTVDDGGRQPANCEYPWTDPAGSRVFVPAEYAFRSLDLAGDPALRLILKILPMAIRSLT